MQALRRTCQILVLIAFASNAFAADDCTQKFWTGNADKAAARGQQQFANAGHASWRTDDVVEVAEQVIRQRKPEWGDSHVVIGVPKILSQTGGEAVLLASSSDDRIRYIVTLAKYGWLLAFAQNDWRQVIWLPTSVERSECAAQR